MNIYRAEDWEHGLRCIDCNREFVEGQPYSERLEAFSDDTPVVEIICLDCALTVTL